MAHLVFVYGTLKRGFPNYAAYLQTAEFLGTCKTEEKYPLVLNGQRYVPCLLDRPGEGCVVAGELFRVDDRGLRRLDGLEAVGRPGGYVRRSISVRMTGGRQSAAMEAFVYLMPPENVTEVRARGLSVYRREHAVKYVRKGPKGRYG